MDIRRVRLPCTIKLPPMKRPVVTYQRSNKAVSTNTTTTTATKSTTTNTTTSIKTSTLLNPDAVLQEKINDLLQSKENYRDPTLKLVLEEEFDSAYIETVGNAKKVHDLVQVGETTRFVDEIEYLLDGLSPPPSRNNSTRISTIRNSLTEIIRKCFLKEGGNSFGLKLKSHGSLLRIFEALTTSQDDRLINENSIRSKLIVLIVGLLHDVRRLDFFFNSKIAIDLAKLCFIGIVDTTDEENSIWDKNDLEIMKASQVCQSCKGSLTSTPILLNFIGIWFLSKWTFASITTASSQSASLFLNEFLADSELIKVVTESVFSVVEVGEKAGSLIDCLLNSPICTDPINNTNPNPFVTSLTPEFFFKLLKQCKDHPNALSFYKVVVSLTGSPFGRTFLSQNRSHFVAVQSLVELMIEEVKDGIDEREGSLSWKLREELIISALINLIDRPAEDQDDDSAILDDFRFQKISTETETGTGTEKSSILQFLTERFVETKSKSSQSSSLSSVSASGSRKEKNSLTSLQALLLGFICRGNKSNLEVLQSTAAAAVTVTVNNKNKNNNKNNNKNTTKEEECVFDIKSEIKNEVKGFISSFKDEEIIFRLQEIMTTFK